MLTIVAVLQRVMDTVEIEFLYKKYFSTKFFAIFAILNGLGKCSTINGMCNAWADTWVSDVTFSDILLLEDLPNISEKMASDPHLPCKSSERSFEVIQK